MEILIVGLVLAFVLFAFCRVAYKYADHREYIKDIVVPLVGPFLLTVAVAWLGHRAELRHAEDVVNQRKLAADDAEIHREISRSEVESQRQSEMMRGVLLSSDRQESNYLIAVDWQLARHLLRLKAIEKSNRTDLSREFDEEAVFYFFGLHRSALTDLYASKGNLAFPRLWMEAAFQDSAQNVILNILGADEMELDVSPIGEAVMYRYFSRSPASRIVPGSEQNSSVSGEFLFDFHRRINLSPSGAAAELDVVLRQEFEAVRMRLRTGKIKLDQLILDLYIMNGLAAYAYNSVLSEWYHLPPELKTEIPSSPLDPSRPPELFLHPFDSQSKRSFGQAAWTRICSSVNKPR
jgi:hypothetical protein